MAAVTRWTAAVLIATALGYGSAPLAAAAETDAQAAIRLAYEGRERFEAGDFRGALERFRSAQTLAASPVLDLYVARSLQGLGRSVEALEHYRRAAEVVLAPDAPAAWVEARRDAHTEQQRLEANVPRLTLQTDAPPRDLSVTLDARPLTWPVVRLPLDPGRHEIVARSGERRLRQVVEAKPGEELRVPLDFNAAAGHTAGAAQPGPTGPTAPPPTVVPSASTETPRSGWSPVVWTSFGVAAAGLAVGAITGGIALSETSKLEEHCDANPCPGGEPQDPDEADRYDRAQTMATVSTVGFVVAGAGAALGVTWLLLDRPRRGASATAVQLDAGLHGLRLRGSF